ncbi:hypothetical protein ZIOFF_068635 [Zingiber officinale]|uniref:Uncharacterized protein n=1 Tax=Zingiber officinale TaxID=94328 RepID=A0A8J5C8H9_ZINOF|nr:hypothetical protein ZIOFF_068635 [Zingiber officinale]
MAGDAERMAVLKRAYADVILNTTKESAVRILAAERRTLQWEQSSSFVKEDSFALILRLKALMDTRIKETESVNLSQATRIRELEVQLREANHKIRRLNSKLQKDSSELENQKSDKSESLQGKDTDDRISLQKNNPDEATSSQETVPHSTYAKYSNQKEPTKDSTASDDSTGTPDLVSLILRNKEPEPFRNGYNAQISNVKQEAPICENELDEKYWLGDLILAAEMLIEVAKSLDSEEALLIQKKHMKETNPKSTRKTLVILKLLEKLACPRLMKGRGKEMQILHVQMRLLIMTKRSMKLHNLNSPNAGQVSIENDQVALTTHDCEEGDPLDGAIKEDAIELPAEVENDRIVKYTFKRTRKKGSPDNKNKDVYLEGNKKLRKADKESALHEKPNKIMELTRDSRRLAQVARQVSKRSISVL